MKNIAPIDRLVASLNKLPGIGRRSAERIAFELAARHDNLLQDLTAALQELVQNTVLCSRCGGITRPGENPCFFCVDQSRNSSILCVVETAMDILLVENAGSYRGRYHVLGGKISPMHGHGLANLKIDALRQRIKTEGVKEVILALNSDVESDATASLVKDLLAGMEIRVSRPAMGLPAGSGIAYSDRLTLNKAIENRQLFQAREKKEEGSPPATPGVALRAGWQKTAVKRRPAE
jgi:recombination protein RecR